MAWHDGPRRMSAESAGMRCAYNKWMNEWLRDNLTPEQIHLKPRAKLASIFKAYLRRMYGEQWRAIVARLAMAETTVPRLAIGHWRNYVRREMFERALRARRLLPVHIRDSEAMTRVVAEYM